VVVVVDLAWGNRGGGERDFSGLGEAGVTSMDIRLDVLWIPKYGLRIWLLQSTAPLSHNIHHIAKRWIKSGY